jgi:1-deoxy-D-xylulose-5-phosphate synthase
MLWPSILFEEFGLEYFGPIDGHNLPLLIESFKFLKAADHPVLLHVLTQKGRGYQPALDGQKKFHGLGPYDPETGMTKPPGLPTYSEVFANTLTELANKNDRIVAITAAMPNGTGLDLFRPHHPTRYFDVGIAEEHAVVFAASGPCAPSTPPFCSARSIRLFTTSACRSCRCCSAWTAPVFPATMDRRITGCSISATCAPFRR